MKRSRFRVLLVERDQPLPRLRLAQMGLSQPTLVLADIEADERGLARQPGCKAGEYLVQVISDGYWSPRLRLRAGTDDPQYDLQVRSIGALFVNATRQGNPLAGVELELVATDFGESVHNWLKDGSLMLGIEALVTDQQGRLALDGLPNGHYRWQARAPDGLRLAGELTLAPFAEVALPIQFP